MIAFEMLGNLGHLQLTSTVSLLQVIPPEEWYASKNYDMIKIGKMVIDSPIAQLVTGQQGKLSEY